MVPSGAGSNNALVHVLEESIGLLAKTTYVRPATGVAQEKP